MAVAFTARRFAPVIVCASSKVVAVTEVRPEPVVIVCAPKTDVVAVTVAGLLDASISIVIAPLVVCAVKSVFPLNALSNCVPVVIVCAPEPVVLNTTFSKFLTFVQSASTDVVAKFPIVKFSVSIPPRPSRWSEIPLNVPTAPLPKVPLKMLSPEVPVRLSLPVVSVITAIVLSTANVALVGTAIMRLLLVSLAPPIVTVAVAISPAGTLRS